MRRRSGDSKLVGGENGVDHDVERDGEEEVLWAVGGESDGEDDGEDDDVDHHQHPLNQSPAKDRASGSGQQLPLGEGTGLMEEDAEELDIDRYLVHGEAKQHPMDPFRDEPTP